MSSLTTLERLEELEKIEKMLLELLDLEEVEGDLENQGLKVLQHRLLLPLKLQKLQLNDIDVK